MGDDQANTISEGSPELAQSLKAIVDKARPKGPALPLEEAHAYAARIEAACAAVVAWEDTPPEPLPKG